MAARVVRWASGVYGKSSLQRPIDRANLEPPDMLVYGTETDVWIAGRET
jgi:hypothetical protein